MGNSTKSPLPDNYRDLAGHVDGRPLPPVQLQLSDAYELAESGDLLSQIRCADALLDCLNASSREAVRSTIRHALGDISHLNTVRANDFRTMLDGIQLALRADQIFDQDTVLVTQDVL